ncbi:hypothetical protein PFNF54_01038, partial [Plasmodium falciparum NF54]
KQKEQFDKQKQKYDEEIKKYTKVASSSSGGRAKRAARGGSNVNGYEKIFYKKLKDSGYESVGEFLDLLSKEEVCKNFKEKEEGKIDFKTVKSSSAKNSDDSNKTFCRTKYCQPCPLCGMKKNNNGEWEHKKKGKCTSGNLYRPIDGAIHTDINFLYSGDRHDDIEKKLNRFCDETNGDTINSVAGVSGTGVVAGSNSRSKELYQEWKCYKGKDVEKVKDGKDEDDEDYEDDYHKEVENAGGLCILENNDGKEKVNKQKTYNDFFYYWVAHMLKDSIHWKKKLEKCLKNGTKTRCKNNKCNRECGCFQKWVEQKKKKEWGKIIEHFYKQEGIPPGTHDITLEGVLKKEVLLTSLQEGYGNAEDIEHIKQLLEEEENEENEGTPGADNKNKNTIDKLLDHEEGIAKECQQKQNECPKKPPKKTPGGPDRALKPEEVDASSEDHYDEEGGEDEEEEEDKEEEGEDGEDVQDDVAEEDTAKEEGSSTTETQLPDACNIVKTLFESTKNFEDACRQKYGPKAPTSWKCVPTTGDKDGATGKSDGSICVPPRRRRLYVGKLHDWASGNTQEDGKAQPQGDTPSQPDPLLKAFVESAAVETFFLWDRYKKLNTKRQGVGAGAPQLQEEDDNDEEEENPQQELEDGTIPDDFLRQMFYTFGDYRDIFFGNNIGSGNDVEKVKPNIDKVFENSEKPTSGGHNSEQQRETWWEEYGPHIWDGMICALSYNTKDKEIIKLAHHNLTSKEIYKYNNVTFIGGFNSDKNSKTETSATKLEEFSRRPTFFRWLEEWGEDFCRKRNDKLKNVKKECRGKYPNGDKQYCSGDGHDCEKTYLKHNDMFADLNCRRCGEQCRNYKQWIEKKLEEFHKQKSIYEKEIPKLKDNYNNHHYKNFYEQIIEKNGYSSFKKFLESFNQRKVCQGNSDQTNNTDFNEPLKTFSLSTYCKTCPLNGLNCGSKECNEVKGKGATWESVLNGKSKDYRRTTGINVEMINRRGKYIEKHTQDSLFKESSLLKSVRDQKWECTFINDKMDICKLNNYNESIDMNKYTTFKVFLENWLQDFLEGYYISKRKIEICTENGENKCIKGCKGKCECVKEWLNKKSTEWKQIKERYKVHHDSKGYDIAHKVRSYFEKNESDVNKSIDNYEVLKKKDEYEDCIDSDTCGPKNNWKKKDMVSILLSELQHNMNKCKTLHDPSGKPEAQCVEPTNPLDDENPDPEDDTSTTSSRPKFCPEIPQPEPEPEPFPEEDTEQEEKEEKLPAAPDNSEQEETSKEVVPEKKMPTPPPKKPEQGPKQRKKQKRQLPTHTSILPEMLSISSFPLTVGVAFAALSYFLLKKKSKSTIDLLRVIDIPKGEYGIPTSKSKNRYIPYASDRYKGKTYIYMEGDESDDYTYIGDISSSDITSSESEYEDIDINNIYPYKSPKYKTLIDVYEDIDINNIYPYKSPKYKTLIDVVLEPSKRDTFNTQSDIPSDTSTNKFTDNEWNQLKQDFISNILQSTQMDLPNENIIDDFMDKGIQPNNPVLDVNMAEKPFITSIHDRDLHNGEEVTYNINFDVSKNINEITNTTDDSKYVSNNIYSGIDLINDSLNSDQHVDIYDELLKRKENEIFGTNHTKHTTTNSIAKQTHTDPILNQLDLFHKWLDRHRNMCEQWNKNKKEELLDKLKEEWNKKNNNNSDLTHTSSNIPSGENSIKNVLNTDVSIQIDMDDPKPINEFTYMDNIIDNLEKNSEPYYDIDEDDIIYFDIDDEKTPMYHNNMDNNKSNVPTKVQIEMNVINKQELFQEEFPISDIWNI